jgi:hypothetical protein
MGMLVTFEIMEKEEELVAVHDGSLGLLIAIGDDWDMLRDMINETVASALGDGPEEVYIEIFIDLNHRTRFKHVYDDAARERIKRRSGR